MPPVVRWRDEKLNIRVEIGSASKESVRNGRSDLKGSPPLADKGRVEFRGIPAHCADLFVPAGRPVEATGTHNSRPAGGTERVESP